MTTALHNGPHGQNHDRFDRPDDLSMRDMLPNEDDRGANGFADITPFQKMLSATSGSLLTGLTMTPLDVVRVRWQSQSVKQQQRNSARAPEFQKLAMKSASTGIFRPSSLGVTSCCREVFFMNNNAEVCVVGPSVSGPPTAAECAVEESRKKTFTSTLDGMRKIAKNEGFFTLWRGLSPTLLMAIPANMIYFTGYEWLRYEKQSPLAGMNDAYAPLIAGAFARVVAAAAVGPIELFRTRLQASHGDSVAGHVKDTLNSMQEMVRSHGYGSLWRGLNLTLWRDVPFSGMYWWGYETIRGKLTEARERSKGRFFDHDIHARRISQIHENHRDTFVDSFIAGTLSGASACIVTMPFDVGKTRTQVYHDSGKSIAGDVKKAGAAPEEQSMFRLLQHIVKTEGAAGLFRGWMPRVMKVAPACAIMISSFEMGKKVFRDINERALEKQKEHNI
ncbi:Mitochondrial carrier protein MTM1 [Cytospora mali]|uniref:Mitochondrial carrier protein MTM1 n=1 Tax=Cytospora mali TaxID=578113 RepID=A0A194W2L4_CYTMA|nr:Mitochondrial carrier protein MTM1 [Valsa mali]